MTEWLPTHTSHFVDARAAFDERRTGCCKLYTSALTAGTVDFWPAQHDSIPTAHRPGLRGSVRLWEVALVLALLCISGNPAALRPAGHETTYAVAAALLACALLLRRGLGDRADRAVRDFVPVASVFMVLSLVHAYAFDFFPIITELGFLSRLFIGMAVVVLVSDFVRAYVVAMVGLSTLSFVFWVPEYITSRTGTPFHHLFAALANRLGPQSKDMWNLGFHTYSLTQPMHRNAGIFWEAGAFAGYIIIALLMLAAIRSSITRTQHLAALSILTLALLSTFSTTGYLAYPIALLLNYDWRKLDRRHRAGIALGVCVIAPLVILGSSYAFSKLDFLQAKIRKEITAVERREYRWHVTRMGNLVFDWEYISKRPLTGWGLHDKTRFALHPGMRDDGFGNGMSNFVVKFGVIGFGIFLLGLIRGAKHISGKSPGYVLGFLAVTLVLLQGEPFLGFPLFLGLMFLGHASTRGKRLAKVLLVESGSPMPSPHLS
jgi:O-antigen ligase